MKAISTELHASVSIQELCIKEKKNTDCVLIFGGECSLYTMERISNFLLFVDNNLNLSNYF